MQIQPFEIVICQQIPPPRLDLSDYLGAIGQLLWVGSSLGRFQLRLRVNMDDDIADITEPRNQGATDTFSQLMAF